MADVLSWAVTFQQYWVKEMTTQYGVWLVSPWCSPAMLIPRPRYDGQAPETPETPSEELSWFVNTPDDKGNNRWNVDVGFPNRQSNAAPR
ncbi:hypothetical protein [Actinopolyspora mortivallis]|uniref:hypothetical protein n=1 Tax=Actinopolyspora mortivallis TaxID=33906 RepID=UPI0011B217AC|nr:hypothetical protein [Actinopolyspora mortivallis]